MLSGTDGVEVVFLRVATVGANDRLDKSDLETRVMKASPIFYVYVPGEPVLRELPADHDIDPIGRLIDRWGMNWEVSAYELTRPDLPIPSTVRELCPNPMLLYYAQRNGVSYLVIHTSIF